MSLVYLLRVFHHCYTTCYSLPWCSVIQLYPHAFATLVLNNDMSHFTSRLREEMKGILDFCLDLIDHCCETTTMFRRERHQIIISAYLRGISSTTSPDMSELALLQQLDRMFL